jgi:exodeoxyribonuclease VII small subunit
VKNNSSQKDVIRGRSTMQDKVGLEENLKMLELIVKELEDGQNGLDESIKKFEQGVKLYKNCKKLIDNAEKKIKVLTDELQEEDY